MPDGPYWETVSEEDGSKGRRGRIFGTFWLMDDPSSFLAVSEVVVVTDEDAIHREEYAYYLVIDGEEIWGWERDLSHDPAVHRHVGADHKRKDADEITFHAAAELAWEEVTRRASGL